MLLFVMILDYILKNWILRICVQPGLNIRTPMNRDRLSDEEMIDYYSKLITGLGGKVTAYYLDGIAVYNHGVISSFMDNMAAQKKRIILYD